MSYAHLANVKHYVYRLRDNEGRLIYVGCTYEPEARMKHHNKTMWWANQVARIGIKVYPSREEGLAAETEARTNEHPRWNVESRWMQNATWTAQMFDDYIMAMELHPSHLTSKRLARIEKARQFRQIRFGIAA